MKKTLCIVFASWCAVAVFAHPLRAQEPAWNNSTGIVSAPLANVHEEPLPKSHLATQVLMGDEVLIREKRDNRYRIEIPSQGNRQGWIQQEAVKVPKDKGRSYLNAGRQWIVVSVPKTEALILHKTGDHKVSLYAGTRLPVLQANGNEFRVQFPDRSEALIDAEEAMLEKPQDPIVNDTKPDDLARTAKRFQGVRYLAGGLSAQGMDTRGLIYITYRIHGIPLDMESAALRSRAEKFSKKDLEPGDILVFFGEGQGLYLGSGRFLQVPKKSSVQPAGIHDRRYANSLQHGLRIIGAGQNETKRVVDMDAGEILLAQARVSRLPVNKRIVYWASRFIGTPYDPDPLGLYVRTNRVVADEKVDCMYHTFRSVELAQSATPGEAVARALNLRFITKGRLADGLVANYDERFQYGEDMVFSTRWGKNLTAELGTTKRIIGSRGRDSVDILPKHVLATRTLQNKLKDGDIVYWVKDPKKRAVGEIVAHLSIVRIKSGKPYLIHAAGDKDRTDKPGGGVVKEVPFTDYVRTMRFIGAFVTRFEP